MICHISGCLFYSMIVYLVYCFSFSLYTARGAIPLCEDTGWEQASPLRRVGRSRGHILGEGGWSGGRLSGEGVGARVTSPARGLEQGSLPRRGCRSRGHLSSEGGQSGGSLPRRGGQSRGHLSCEGGRSRGRLSGKGVVTGVASPARGSEQGSPLRQGGLGRGHLSGEGVGA